MTKAGHAPLEGKRTLNSRFRIRVNTHGATSVLRGQAVEHAEHVKRRRVATARGNRVAAAPRPLCTRFC